MEVEDLHDVPEETAVTASPVSPSLAGNHAAPQPRIIDVRATDRRTRKAQDATIGDPAPSGQTHAGQSSPIEPGSGVSGYDRSAGFGAPGLAASKPGPEIVEPNLDDFLFEKDEFLIAQSEGRSKRSAWLEMLSLPIVLVLSIIHRIGRGRDRTPDDEIEVASKRTFRGSWIPGLGRSSNKESADFGFDDRSPDSSAAAVASHTETPVDFAISSEARAKSAHRVVDSESQPPAHISAEVGEDYQVATGTELRRTRFRPDSDTSPDNQGPPGVPGSSVAGSISDTNDQGISQASSLSDRWENLLDYSSRDLHSVIDDGADAAGTPLEQDVHRTTGESLSLGRLIVRFAAWFMSIPKRCLTAQGDLSDQNRLKIEPLIASVPALFAIVTQIFSMSNFFARDKFEASNSYLKAAKANDAAGNRDLALISAIRSCSESVTPNNQYEYAYLRTRSTKPEDANRGLRLIRNLASPAGGNQPDAHLYIANEILRRSSSSPELRQRSVPYYLAELRAGFEASHQRYDILEKLAEALTDRSEDMTLTNLITPHLDYWPLGHFFLAQAAFSRGDSILQKTHAFALVKHFQGSPTELDEKENARIRYVIGLALAGEFDSATELTTNYFGSDSNLQLREQLSERIKLIRLIARLGGFPEGTDRDIEALGAELFSTELTPLYESAVKRQLLRKGPLRSALVDLCRKLHAERKESFDAEDYVFWASILRQNQQNAEAREYLENATRLDPKNDVAANNLANLLYKIEPYELERALAFAQGVLTRNPANPIYLETRGQILARLGKNQEAIDDLGRCLVTFPEVPEIHETLAGCYRKIGNEVLANAHQNRYEELKAKATTNPAKPSP